MSSGSNGTKVELIAPLMIDGKAVDALYVRRPKVKDLLEVNRQALKDDVESDLAMLGRLTGFDPPVLEDLDLGDYRRLEEVFSGFLSFEPET